MSEFHCPVDGCDWWVPSGMEYLYTAHRDEHSDDAIDDDTNDDDDGICPSCGEPRYNEECPLCLMVEDVATNRAAYKEMEQP